LSNCKKYLFNETALLSLHESITFSMTVRVSFNMLCSLFFDKPNQSLGYTVDYTAIL